MNQKQIFMALAIFLMALILPACNTARQAVAADKAVAAEAAAPVGYTVDISANGLTMPEKLPGGIVTVTFANKSEAQHMPILARFKQDVTVEQFNTAMASEDPMAAFSLVHLLSGTSLAPNAEQQIVYDLKAGQHVLLDFGEQGPQTAFFEVTAEVSPADIPAAGIKADLKDFAVILPDEIKAGPQTWHIQNSGGQWHELQIVRLNEGVTIQEVIDLMGQDGPPAGPPPFEPVAFVPPLSEGEQLWTTFDLEPGVYTIICVLPDVAGAEHHSHAQLGMVRQLTVIK